MAAIGVFLRDPRRMLNTSYFIYFFSLTTWSFGVYGRTSDAEGAGIFWITMLSAGMMFLPAAFLFFLTFFLEEEYVPPRWLSTGSGVISSVFFILSFSPYMYRNVSGKGFGDGIVRELWFGFLLYFSLILFFGLFLIYRNLANSEGRRLRQLMYAFLGHLLFLIGIYLSIPAMMGREILGGFPFWSLSNTVYAAMLGSVILLRNFPDLRLGIRFLASRITGLVLFALVLYGILVIFSVPHNLMNNLIFASISIAFLYVTGELFPLIREKLDYLYSLVLGMDPVRYKEKNRGSAGVKGPAFKDPGLFKIQENLIEGLRPRGVHAGAMESIESRSTPIPNLASVQGVILENRNSLHEIFGAEITAASDSMYRVLRNILEYGSLNRPVVFEGDPGTGKRVLARSMHHIRNGGDLKEFSCRDEKLPAIRGMVKRFLEAPVDEKKPAGLLVSDVEYVKPELARVLAPLFEVYDGKKFVYFTTINADFARVDANTRFFTGLNEQIIRIPPLMTRPEDLLVYTIDQVLKNVEDPSMISIEKSFLDSVFEYRWPWNHLELEEAIRDSVYASADGVLQTVQIERKELARPTESLSPLEECEKRVILEYLMKNRFNKNRTRLDLSITINTLNSKIQKYGIHTEE